MPAIDFRPIDFQPEVEPQETQIDPEWEAERAGLVEQQRAAARAGAVSGLGFEAANLGEGLVEGMVSAFSPSAWARTLEANTENAASAVAGRRLAIKPEFKLSPVMDKPLLKIPEIPIAEGAPAVSQGAAGMINGMIEFVNFLQSPEGVSMLGIGALPKAAQKAVTTTFAGNMLAAAPQNFNQAVEDIRNKKYGEAGKNVAGFLINSGMGAHLAGNIMEKPPMMKVPGPPTPEQMAARADVRARNLAAPGTMRPGELQVPAPPGPESPAGMHVDPRAWRPTPEQIGRMPVQMFDLPPTPPRPTIVPPAEFPATETRGKVSFGGEAAAEGIPNARQQAPGGVVGGERQPGIIEAVSSIARNPDRLALEGMRSQIEKEIGAGVADASRNDLLRLIDSRLKEIQTGKFDPELSAIRMTLGRGRPTMEVQTPEPPERKQLTFPSEQAAEAKIKEASRLLPNAAKAAELPVTPLVEPPPVTNFPEPVKSGGTPMGPIEQAQRFGAHTLDFDRLYRSEHANLLELKRQQEEAAKFEPEKADALKVEIEDAVQRLEQFDKLSKREAGWRPSTPEEATAAAIRSNPNISLSDAVSEGQRMLRQIAEDDLTDAPANIRLQPQPPAPPPAVSPTPTPNASQVPPPAALHGNVRPLEAPPGVMPVQESGPRVQPQAPRGVPEARPQAGPAQPEVLLKPVIEIGGKRFYGRTHSVALEAAKAARDRGEISKTAWEEAVMAELQGTLPHQFEDAKGDLKNRKQAAAIVEEAYPGVKVPDGELQSEFYNDLPPRPSASATPKVDFKPEPGPATAANPSFERPPPPNTPRQVKGETTEESFEKWQKNVRKYESDLAAWEAGIPENERLIFDGEYHVTFISKEPTGGWRSTWVNKKDQIPTGHSVYKTRLEAIRSTGHDRRIEKMPFEIKPLPERVAPMEKPAEAAKPAEAKQPLEMTRDEVLSGGFSSRLKAASSTPWLLRGIEYDSIKSPLGKAQGKRHPKLIAEHKKLIKKAIEEGKTVPPEVLADYPDLKPKATEAPAAPAPEPAKPAEAPPPAEAAPVAQMQAEVSKVAAEEGVKSAADIKAELVQRLTDATREAKKSTDDYLDGYWVFKGELKKRPIALSTPLIRWLNSRVSQKSGETETFRETDLGAKLIGEALAEQGVEKVTIAIPGDGTFEVWKTKDNLQGLLDRASKIKTTPENLEPKGPPSGEPRKAVSLGMGGKAEEGVKIARAINPFLSDDPQRTVINFSYSDGTQMIATDGRQMLRVVTDKAPGAPHDPVRLNAKGEIVKGDTGGDFPNWQQVRPKDAELAIGGLDTESVWLITNQAWAFRDEFAPDKSKRLGIGMDLFQNPDGSIGGKIDVQGEMFSHNVQEGAKSLGRYNPEYLNNQMDVARKLGNKRVDLYFDSTDGPAMFVGKNHEGLVMPIRGEAGVGRVSPNELKRSRAEHRMLPEGYGPLKSADTYISKDAGGNIRVSVESGKLKVEMEEKVGTGATSYKSILEIAQLPIEEIPKDAKGQAKAISEWFKAKGKTIPANNVKGVAGTIREVLKQREDIRGEVAKRKPYKASADEIAKKLDEWKAPGTGSGAMNVFGVTNELWNLGVDAAKAVIRGGGSVADAIEAAVVFIKDRFKGPWEEARARAAIGLTLNTGINPATLRPVNVSPATQGASSTLKKVRNSIATMAKTGDVRETMTFTQEAGENAANIYAGQVANDVRNALSRATGRNVMPPSSIVDPVLAKMQGRSSYNAQRQLAEEALTFVREAGGDIEELRAARAKVAGSTQASRKWKARALAAIDYGIAHWNEVNGVASRDYASKLAQQIVDEHSNGINTPTRDNYVPHLQEMPNEFGIYESSAGGAGGGGFRHIRSFKTLADSIAAGVDPQSINAIDLMQRRIAAGHRLINSRAWIQSLRDTADPKTGNPIVTNPLIIPRGIGQPADFQAPPGYKIETVAGRPMAVLSGYAGILGDLTEPSYLARNTWLQAARKAGATGKHIALMIDTFHLARLAFWESAAKAASITNFKAPIPSFKKGLISLDYTPAEIRRMAAAGEIKAGHLTRILDTKEKVEKLTKAGYNINGIADNLHSEWTQKIPLSGHFNKWLFQQFQRGAMAEVGALEFDRYKKMYSNLSESQIARAVAEDLNTRFGNIGKQGLLRSKTTQDLARLIFLAPQWNEGLIRSEIGAVLGRRGLVRGTISSIKNRKLQYGLLPRVVGTMILGQFVANQLINLITRGKPTWENEEEGMGAKLSAWIPDAIGEGPGMFLHPFGLAAEITHLLHAKHERTGSVRQTAKAFGVSRASALTRPMAVYGFGQDPFGRALRESEVIPETIKAAVPLPIPTKSVVGAAKSLSTGQRSEEFAGQFQRQLLSSMGVKTDQAPSKTQRIFDLAKKFNEAKGVEQSGIFYQGDFTEIQRLLSIGNKVDAKSEMDNLMKKYSRKALLDHAFRYAQRPFTGSSTREVLFMRSLTPEQKKTYKDALQEKRKVFKDFIGLLRQYKP